MSRIGTSANASSTRLTSAFIVQKPPHGCQRWNPRLPTRPSGLQRRRGCREPNALFKPHASRQCEGVGAVEHVPAAGGIDRLDLEGRLVPWYRLTLSQIPAAFVPAGHDGNLPVRTGQFADGLRWGAATGEPLGKSLRYNQMISQGQ